jgi:LysM repeat protein
LANNPDLRDSNSLIVGQALIVPAANGIIHEVRAGETLADIATKYGVSVEGIVELPIDRIADGTIDPGQVLLVPGGVAPAID